MWYKLHSKNAELLKLKKVSLLLRGPTGIKYLILGGGKIKR